MNNLAVIGEFLGTFLFAITCLMTENALVIGGVMALIVLLLGGVSGAHVNPAISIAMFLKGTMGSMELVTFTIAQCLGAAGAYYTYNVLA
jgi:aquaporin Z